MPSKKLLIFLDIDGTLIQKNLRPNSAVLPKIIKRLSERGFLFGLNSNRALEDVLPVYKKFDLNGPLVLENGTYFKKDLGSKEQFLISNPKNISKITATAIKSFADFYRLDATVKIADTVKIIKQNERLKKIPQGIFANKFRKYSSSVHLFKYGERDLETAKKMSGFLRKYFKQHKLELDVEVPRYSDNIVFWPSKCDKGTALKKLKKYYSDYAFSMIGDDLADLKTLGQLKYFFAVGNAQPEVKKKADFVSKKTYTQGVVEILNKFLADPDFMQNLGK